MPRPDKAAAVAELTEEFRSSGAAVLTEYRGLTVGQISQLRIALGTQTTYAVVKNTLTRIAARDAGVDALDALLQGPSAIAFVKGDPVEAARGLRDFARVNPLLVIKGGVLEGKALSAEEITRLADLESREVLLARVAGGFTASLARAAALLQAPVAQAARLAEALRQKAEQDPGVLRGEAGSTAAAAAPDPGAGTADAGLGAGVGAESGAPDAAAPDPADPADPADPVVEPAGGEAPPLEDPATGQG